MKDVKNIKKSVNGQVKNDVKMSKPKYKEKLDDDSMLSIDD